MSRQVAVIGLGNMGSGIASTLRDAAVPVLGVDPAAPEDAVPGVRRVQLVDAVDQADVLILSLPSSEVVHEVLQSAGLLAESSVPPRLIIDTSTADPLQTRELATQLAAAGHSMVDAPVSGGPAGAATGKLTVFLGGEDSTVLAARPTLEVMAKQITHVGPPGAGAVAKLVNNMLVAMHLQSAGEALALIEAAELDPSRILTAVNTASGRSGVTETNLPQWVLSGRFDSGFPVGLMSRDIHLAIQAAEGFGIDLPMAAHSAAAWKQLNESDPGADFNHMAVQPLGSNPVNQRKGHNADNSHG